LFFKIAIEDTVSPSLIRAVPSNRNHLVLQFDEPISILSQIHAPAITIISDEKTDDTLTVYHMYSDPLNKQRLHVITHDQDPEKQYRISVHTVTDNSGNPIAEMYHEVTFKGSGEADTTRPVLVQTIPQANARSVSLNIIVSLIFDGAMDSTEFEEGFSLSDSSGRSIAGPIRWMNPVEMLYQLNEPLKSQTTYTIGLSGEHVSDLAGNSIADTLFQFHTLNQDTLSSILGHIFDSSLEDSGKIFIYAKQLENPEISYTQILPEPGPYQFSDILPGRYFIECYRDHDGNGEFNKGSVFPFRFSERFYVYPDTITVRSRWPNEGNNFKLP
ncbi:Ig-like domain-containing protein, partial [bacterium]|nr:Ig-like domain-containing protein [bacterium]